MAKFNAVHKKPKKVRIIKTPKLPTEEMKRNVVQKLVSNDVLRTSKYHKKIQSNVRKTIN